MRFNLNVLLITYSTYCAVPLNSCIYMIYWNHLCSTQYLTSRIPTIFLFLRRMKWKHPAHDMENLLHWTSKFGRFRKYLKQYLFGQVDGEPLVRFNAYGAHVTRDAQNVQLCWPCWAEERRTCSRNYFGRICHRLNQTLLHIVASSDRRELYKWNSFDPGQFRYAVQAKQIA